MASVQYIKTKHDTVQKGKVRLAWDLVSSYLPWQSSMAMLLKIACHSDLSVQPLTALFVSIKLAFETLPQSNIIQFEATATRTHNHICAATNLQFSPISVAMRNDLFLLFSKLIAACLHTVLPINQTWLALNVLFNV